MKYYKDRIDMICNLIDRNSIGAEIGCQKSIFSKNIHAIINPKELHLIDLFADEKNYLISKENTKNLKNTFLHKGNSIDLYKNFKNNYFDWVYIDADHTYDAVISDLNNWSSKVKEDGWIMGHDYVLSNYHQYAENWGVIPAVFDFILKNNYEIHCLTDEFWSSFAIKKRSLNINQKLIYLFGMSRGGHHAIVDWILSTYKGTKRHWNNCRIECGFYAHNRELREIKAAASHLGCDILSFENKNLEQITNTNVCKVLVIRDILNLTASRIKLSQKVKKTFYNFEDSLEIWKQYAREFLGQTNFLKKCIKINFNCWFLSKNYRNFINLNFGNLVGNNTNISNFCGGSSFDGLTKNARELNVISRWREFKHHEEIQRIFNDDEAMDLNQKIAMSTGSEILL
jgi:hypothetical protein